MRLNEETHNLFAVAVWGFAALTHTGRTGIFVTFFTIPHPILDREIETTPTELTAIFDLRLGIGQSIHDLMFFRAATLGLAAYNTREVARPLWILISRIILMIQETAFHTVILLTLLTEKALLLWWSGLTLFIIHRDIQTFNANKILIVWFCDRLNCTFRA